MHTIDVLLLDVQSDLPLMYSVSEVAFIGNSLTASCSGSSISQAAVSGCAVLTGPHTRTTADANAELNRAALAASHDAESPDLEIAAADMREAGPPSVLQDPRYLAPLIPTDQTDLTPPSQVKSTAPPHTSTPTSLLSSLPGSSFSCTTYSAYLQGSSSAGDGSSWNPSQELWGNSHDARLSPSGEVSSWDHSHSAAAAAAATPAAIQHQQQQQVVKGHQSIVAPLDSHLAERKVGCILEVREKGESEAGWPFIVVMYFSPAGGAFRHPSYTLFGCVARCMSSGGRFLCTEHA